MSECNCVDTGHKQDCPLGKDLRIAAMQEQIAILETSLAERWENLNVQDGIIDGLQEEIAALRVEDAKRDAWYQESAAQFAALEKVAEVAARHGNDDRELDEALREAGYLKENGDVLA